MTLADLRQLAADQDAAINDRLARLFAPPARRRGRKATPASPQVWMRATAPQERADTSILAALRTYRPNQQPAVFKRKHGKAISLTPSATRSDKLLEKVSTLVQY